MRDWVAGRTPTRAGLEGCPRCSTDRGLADIAEPYCYLLGLYLGDGCVDRSPEPLLRGLIHSDGCRAINTGRGGWSHPRYSFSNRSVDIHAIFRAACAWVGVRFTVAPHTTYVSRKADVARLDTFIGPKR